MAEGNGGGCKTCTASPRNAGCTFCFASERADGENRLLLAAMTVNSAVVRSRTVPRYLTWLSEELGNHVDSTAAIQKS